MTLNMKNSLFCPCYEPEFTVLQQRVISNRQPASQLGALLSAMSSMHIGVDITTAATYWLGLRIIYVPLYVRHLIFAQRLVGSLVCMVYIHS